MICDPEELKILRTHLDKIDEKLISILCQRFSYTKKIGLLKKKYKLPPKDPEREKAQISHLRKLAEEKNLNPDFIEKLIYLIHEEVIENHKQA